MQVGVTKEIVNFLIFLMLVKVSEEITASSKVWPYYTPWTLSDVKTAAWLVEKGHLTQLERVKLSSDLDTTSVSNEVMSVRQVASNTLSKPDEDILIKPNQGPDILHIYFVNFVSCVNSLTSY